MSKEIIMEFLKPDKRKNLIAIILSIFFIIGLIISRGVGPHPTIIDIFIFNIFVALTYPLSILFKLINVTIINPPLQLIIIFFYAYLLSCLIIFIYDKFKKIK